MTWNITLRFNTDRTQTTVLFCPWYYSQYLFYNNLKPGILPWVFWSLSPAGSGTWPGSSCLCILLPPPSRVSRITRYMQIIVFCTVTLCLWLGEWKPDTPDRNVCSHSTCLNRSLIKKTMDSTTFNIVGYMKYKTIAHICWLILIVGLFMHLSFMKCGSRYKKAVLQHVYFNISNNQCPLSSFNCIICCQYCNLCYPLIWMQYICNANVQMKPQSSCRPVFPLSLRRMWYMMRSAWNQIGWFFAICLQVWDMFLHVLCWPQSQASGNNTCLLAYIYIFVHAHGRASCALNASWEVKTLYKVTILHKTYI